MSTSTDVSEITKEVSGITISGPGTSEPAARIELNDEDALGADVTMTVVKPDGTETEPIIVRDVTPAEDALFDSSSWNTVPRIDGQSVDSLVFAFGGSIKYAASDPSGREMFDALALGKEVALRIEAVVATKAGGFKLVSLGGDLGEREEITAKTTLKVTDLYRLAPEAL